MKYKIQDYADMKATAYLSDDKRSGYVLTKEYDLISFFSLPTAKQGTSALISAIKNGAKTVNCFDGLLKELYSKHGFIEYKRITWNDDDAPEDWDYAKFNKPDIIYMKLDIKKLTK